MTCPRNRVAARSSGSVQWDIFAPTVLSVSNGDIGSGKNFSVPSATDARIEELCARIRVLCWGSFTPETERELRTLAKELQVAIKDHVRRAKSSLSTKQSAILARDPDAR